MAQWARQRFSTARVARLATISPQGRPHLVPVVFAVSDDTVWTAVDHKPKATRSLRRLQNISANPRVSLLVDHYDDADWSALWWVRADGLARVVEAASPEGRRGLGLLAAKYDAYRHDPPAGPVVTVAVDAWRGWAATTPPEGGDQDRDQDRDRDRDAAGRARQARPRDALGRPLPYGSRGVEPVPEEPLPPQQAIATARALLEAGRPFSAHEVFEARWKAAPPQERDLWQGLAQLCVALTHAERGNRVGAGRLFDRACERLRQYDHGGGPAYGLDLMALIGWAGGRLAGGAEGRDPT